jgi:hypothetical protein
MKPTITGHLTNSEKKGAIDAALKGGMEPAEVFKAVLQGVYGVSERKKVVIEWGKKMGLDASESLRIAQGATLIPTKRPPRGKSQEKPPRKT